MLTIGNLRLTASVLFVVSALVGCFGLPQPEPKARAIDDSEALVLATFHKFYGLESEPWQNLVLEANGKPSPKVEVTHYYITVLNKDPPTSLLVLFKTTGAAFHPGSEFRAGNGVKFSIEEINFSSATSAVVEFVHYCGRECGSVTQYFFEKRNGNWEFVKEHPRYIF